MNVVVIFDLSADHPQVIQALTAKGYYTRWSSKEQIYNLPKSCVWKPNTTIPETKAEFIKIISELGININILRLLVLPASPWDGIVGEKI